MTLRKESLYLHKKFRGKLEVRPKVSVRNMKDLSLAYSPGVAEPCKEIFRDEEKLYEYTAVGNLVAVVSDGSAVLGLGNIGPRAAMPVMEGKAVLFKTFGDINAVPICLDTTDVDTVVETVKTLEPSFAGVNLEDIAAPRCFEIEERLIEECSIPIFHDDQHGTAIVTLAGLINALKLTGKSLDDIRVTISGSGSAGVSIVRLLSRMGVKHMTICDSQGVIYKGRSSGMNKIKDEIASLSNAKKLSGTVADAIAGSDVFIGVSIAGIVTKEMVKSMKPDPIIFAMANPIPEIMPEEALEAGAAVIGTGRSDYPNQVNNVLAFPGVFRGALDVRAREINEQMKIAAVYALANIISDQDLRPDYVIPSPFDPRVVPRVAEAVSNAAIDSGVAEIMETDRSYVPQDG